MTEDLGHGEIQELLGAYALDAVDETERSVIEAHLLTCESCREELEDHHRMAETLRRHALRVSPLASTGSNGSARSNNHVTPRGPVPRWGVALALALVVILAGATSVPGQIRYHHLTATTARIERLERAQLAAADPAAVVTSLRTPGDEPVLTVVNRGRDSYAFNSGLPRVGDGRMYQLWRVDGAGDTTAAAAMGRHPDAVVFSLPAGVVGFVVTVETNPAPNRPTRPAVASSAGMVP